MTTGGFAAATAPEEPARHYVVGGLPIHHDASVPGIVILIVNRLDVYNA